MDGDGPAKEVVFRPSKRRKVLRQRSVDEEVGASDVVTVDQQPGYDVGGPYIASPARAIPSISRRSRGNQKFGVTFSTANKAEGSADVSSQQLATANVVPQTAAMNAGRFMPAIGEVTVKDDKHMTAYIDSKLAEMHSTRSRSVPPVESMSNRIPNAASPNGSVPNQPEGIKSRHHTVEEVEIIPGEPETASVPSKDRKRKEPRPRLDRHGRPLPPRRPRNWRSEDDKARDSLVDRLLAENRLEGIYDSSSANAALGAKGVDTDADRRMAEEFEREFRANVEERKIKQASASAKTAESASGPKLGGSKNARMVKK
ncbi:hypothetical protein BDZ85DRAFT_6871 [Elsinoe ampelina]|uniref:Hepatocellular carcinoma-associated antigen 59-domain-containing protein n=1 Tax=Elsinoe ampelina TaxID=302913 RepID=A0A6A6GQ37_9PEZI|nr:hypothetical protein BDZ85DRAFT_6871 [Elsinoe ampelina]